jgi:hypothetical protein
MRAHQATTLMTAEINPNIGRTFQIKTSAGFMQMECVIWDSETRAFKNEQGFVEMDWMEYLDQQAMGNIYKA